MIVAQSVVVYSVLKAKMVWLLPVVGNKYANTIHLRASSGNDSSKAACRPGTTVHVNFREACAFKGLIVLKLSD